MHEKKQHIYNYVRSWVDNNRFTGTILVAENNEIIFNHGYGYQNKKSEIINHTNTIFKIGSLTKLYIATLVLKLYEQSKIQLQDTIDCYIDCYKHGDKVTVHQLLSHTSGIIDHTQLKEYDMKSFMSFEMFIDRINSYDLKFNPGNEFDYSNSNYTLLAKIIENITGQCIDDHIKEVCIEPLKLIHTGVFKPDTIYDDLAFAYTYSGEGIVDAKPYDMSGAYGSGFMYANTLDVFNFITALFSGKLLKDETLHMMIKPLAYVWYLDAYSAYGCFLSNKNQNAIVVNGMISGYSSNLWYDYDQNKAIIILSNNDTTPMSRLTEGIINILNHMPPKRELFVNEPHQIKLQMLNQLVGHYDSIYTEGFFNIKIINQAIYVDRLWAQTYKDEWYELICVQEDQDQLIFITNVCEGTFTFKLDNNQKLSEVFYTFDTFTLPYKKQ